jgi:hypothetical protein
VFSVNLICVHHSKPHAGEKAVRFESTRHNLPDNMRNNWTQNGREVRTHGALAEKIQRRKLFL